ncbi:MAG: SMI1/KNR4 family protein [Acutalibacteraceae bacterium]|nr:SMI1/KNR4 family protein [Acutalibacteraceae bacterium]
MKDKILELINSNEEIFGDAFFKRYPTDEELEKAESDLGFKIPEEYVWFLKTFGWGGFLFEFLGYGFNGSAMLVDKTLEEREYGLPENLLVIENCDEYVHCIDVVTKEVVSWSCYDKDGVIKVNDNFYDFFLDNIDNAIENYDDF